MWWKEGAGIAPWYIPLGGLLAGGGTLLSLKPLLRFGKRAEHFWLGSVLLGVAATVLLSAGSGFIVPWGALAGLGAMFFGAEFGILTLLPLTAWGVVYLGPWPAVVGFFGGIIMAVALPKVRRARDLLLYGAIVGGSSGILTLVFIGEAGPSGIIAALATGPLSSLFIWTAIPVAERLLDKTSPLTLVELLDPSHPLLERLRRDAPGTYYHSRNVSALAEAAARAIGANALLAAVGGLYHDIGKLTRPDFFVENQEGSNPHDELNPSLSKIILLSHVKEGVELARQHGLLGDVVAFIATHHGTSVMRYFSERGAEQGLSPHEFRYTSPLPDTKETAIVMLADPLEAAARSRTKEEIPELVEALVEERRADGQLDRAPLTMAELTKVKQAFVKVLQGMAHPRVANYPLFQAK